MRTLLCSLISLLLLLCSYHPKLPSVSMASAEYYDLANQMQTIEQVEEVVEKRTLNSETYLLSDGSYECIVHSNNIFYKDQDCLKRIDNTLCTDISDYPDYIYTNKANSWKVFFSDKGNNTIIVKSNDYIISISLDPGSSLRLIPNGLQGIKGINEYSLYGDNCLAYNSVLPDTHFVYSVFESGIKEYIVLEKKPSFSEIHFQITAKELAIQNGMDGKTLFIDKNGKEVFSFSKTIAYNTYNKEECFLPLSITPIDNDVYDCCISMSDLIFSCDEDNIYPIIIDPTVNVSGVSTTYDSYVSSRYPTNNYYSNIYLRTGRDSDYYARRSYIRFDLPSNLSNDTIQYAYLNIKYYSGSTPTVTAKRVTGSWASNTITWNNRPSETSTDSATLVLYSNNWYRANITNIVKGWIYNNYSNYGIVLKDNTETGTDHWTTFYSSDAPSPNKPELRIVYSSNRSAILLGVTNSGHDHSTCLTNAIPYISNCSIGEVYKYVGSFTSTQVSNYLSNNQNCLFTSRSHGTIQVNSSNQQIGTNLVLNDDDTNPLYYRSSTMPSNLDLSNMNLIMFIGCKTAHGSANLPQAAVQHGARTAVGFQDSITCSSANTWTTQFYNYMSQNYSVQGACSTLAGLAMYSGTGLEQYKIYGFTYTYIK